MDPSDTLLATNYEVKVDGEWVPVPNDEINNVVVPDGGAHVCASRQVGPNKRTAEKSKRATSFAAVIRSARSCHLKCMEAA
jgi:hypothetical protein